MSEIKRSSLFGKLNTLGYKAIESATSFCKMRGNSKVEIVHWLHQIYQQQDSDLLRLTNHYGLEAGRVAADLVAALDRLPRNAGGSFDFSSDLEHTIERAWVFGSLMFGESQIRTGHLLLASLRTRELKHGLLSISREFSKIKEEELADHFESLLAQSCEETMAATDGSSFSKESDSTTEQSNVPGGLAGKQEALAKFTVDLTDKAKKGEIDPIAGRDDEIRQVIDILMRRRQNNPILTGEAGVGKTAIVEGFALRICAGDVPPALKNIRLLTLDLGLLQAGASLKGEFENRLKGVIEEVQSSPTPIILFIDEAHTLIGAGGAAGQGDAANLLKPALARGTLRTIAATTWAEYKKYFEKDPALTRRFQVIKVEEPDEEKAVKMVRGLIGVLEKHHGVQVLDEAVRAAVSLSHRYIPSRQLPDKAVSLLDTACARTAISQHATPARLEDCTRLIHALEAEQKILEREGVVGRENGERQSKITATLEVERQRQIELEASWTEEIGKVRAILELRRKLVEIANPPAAPAPTNGNAPADPDPLVEDPVPILAELKKLEAELAAIQGEHPLILPSVDEQAIASVVADWTGIPVGRMVKNEIQAVLNLVDTLEKRIIGQRHALEVIARRIQTSRARLDNPGKPIGVFLLAGTSGVGKTETALTLAEALYGGETNVITINMSEFQEAHTVSTLKGAPPGYVGYGEGGVLTEAVRRRPYSVVLLDEVEKAHPDVHEIFFQVFDKGFMEDGEGRFIDFKNTIILLTTNVGSDLIMNMCKEPDLAPDAESLAKALRPSLLKVFPAALLGRLVTVPYFPLSDDMLKAIIHLQLNRIVKRVAENQEIALSYTPEVVELVASRCTEIESGGRMVDSILTQTLLPEVSRELLTRLMDGNPAKKIEVDARDAAFTYQFE